MSYLVECPKIPR